MRLKISIHALREEGDITTERFGWCSEKFLSTPSARRATRRAPRRQQPGAISIHALREEGDAERVVVPDRLKGFLSTPSARRATVLSALSSQPLYNFYPRPPRGGRPAQSLRRRRPSRISIHALREEGDVLEKVVYQKLNEFLSTPSARRATMVRWGSRETKKFLSTPSARRATTDLNDGEIYEMEFLSTPSARRATAGPSDYIGGDGNFYPRPPRGGRQQKQRQNLYFLINYTTFCTNLEEP